MHEKHPALPEDQSLQHLYHQCASLLLRNLAGPKVWCDSTRGAGEELLETTQLPATSTSPSNVDAWGGLVTFLGCPRTVSTTPPLSLSRGPLGSGHLVVYKPPGEASCARKWNNTSSPQGCLTKSGMKCGSALPRNCCGELLSVTVVAGNGRHRLKNPMMMRMMMIMMMTNNTITNHPHDARTPLSPFELLKYAHYKNYSNCLL